MAAIWIFLYRVIAQYHEIWRTIFPMKFFHEIWLKVAD